jgi:hypothetical protein
VHFYAPYASSAAELRDIRRTDRHDIVEYIEHRKLAESLCDYFRHPEWKSGDPHGVGPLPRRHVSVWRYQAIGKESNALALMSAEDTDGTVDGEGAGVDGAQIFDIGSVQETLQHYRVAELMRATGLSRRTLYNLRSGKVISPSEKTLAALAHGLMLRAPAYNKL